VLTVSKLCYRIKNSKIVLGIWIRLEEYMKEALIRNCGTPAVHVISIEEMNIACQFTNKYDLR